jgi:WD40 repeat protein
MADQKNQTPPTPGSAADPIEVARKQFRQLLGQARAFASDDPAQAYQHLSLARAVPGYSRDPEVLALKANLARSIPARSLREAWSARAFEGNDKSVRELAMTPDGRFLATLGFDERNLHLWNLATGACERTFMGHKEYVNAMAMTPDGHFLVSASDDNTLRLWRIATGACVRVLKGHHYDVNTVALTPDGRLAVSGSHDHDLRLWKLASGACLRTFQGHASAVKAVMVTPDGRFAVSEASDDKTLRLWDLASGKCLRTFEGSASPMTFTPDGHLVASECGNSILHLWELGTEASLRTFEGRLRSDRLVVTPDGRLLVSVEADDTARIWDLTTGACLRTFGDSTNKVSYLKLTSDGRFAFTHSSYSRRLGLWELATAALVRTFDGNGGFANMSVSPDNRFVVWANSENTMYLWELDWELDVAAYTALPEKEKARRRAEACRNAAMEAQPSGLFGRIGRLFAGKKSG